MKSAASLDITVVGHPFAPLGMGQQVRACFGALKEVGAEPKLLDVYRYNERTDRDLERTLAAALTDTLSPNVNIFNINGDEVKPVLKHLSDPNFERAFNVICPAWELEKYPETWAEMIDKFDEVWAPSSFVADAIRSKVSTPVVTMPIAVEPKLSQFMGRRALGLPEHSFIFLFFFDFSSYASRKNPFAVISAFNQLAETHPDWRTLLVLKHKGRAASPQIEARYRRSISAHPDKIKIIDHTMKQAETYNLVRSVNCFVSLHRSEGFGLGLAEAMALGTPVIATGWSGNMDFMTTENAWLVDHDFVDVGADDYPFGKSQRWAEPSVEHAIELMAEVYLNRDESRRRARRAQLDIQRTNSKRAIGLRYLERLAPIMEKQVALAP